MTFNIVTQINPDSEHLWPHLTRKQLLNIMEETALDGGLRSRVSQWINSDEPMFIGIDFADRQFTIVRN